MNERIPGVVVTYFPDAEFEFRLGAIGQQFSPIIVADNTTDPAAKAVIEAIAKRQGCDYRPQGRNCGIAGALNLAFSDLAKSGTRRAAAFDQDSLPHPGLMAELVGCADRNRDHAVIGSNWQDAARPKYSPRHLARTPGRWPAFRPMPVGAIDLPDVAFVITSGALFALPVWQKLGGFDDGLFLDFVDIDYCLRARSRGYNVAVAAQALLLHRRGNKSPRRWCGRTWWPSNTPPDRLYYLWRNRMLMWRRHALRHSEWLAQDVAFALHGLFCAAFLEGETKGKLLAIAKGVNAGLMGTRGEFAPVRSGS